MVFASKCGSSASNAKGSLGRVYGIRRMGNERSYYPKFAMDSNPQTGSEYPLYHETFYTRAKIASSPFETTVTVQNAKWYDKMKNMEVRQCSSGGELSSYDAWLKAHPHGSLWQSLEWKRYQETLGRETRIYALMEGRQILASALVIIDRTAFGFSTWDIPRGPLGPRMDNGKLTMENVFA